MEWTEARDANVAKVEGHPRFRDLVRAVAVAEQGGGKYVRMQWMRRNSVTYGIWVHRGEKPRTRGSSMQRAWRIAEQIAKDTGVLADSREASAGTAVAYVAARGYARARLAGPRR